VEVERDRQGKSARRKARKKGSAVKEEGEEWELHEAKDGEKEIVRAAGASPVGMTEPCRFAPVMCPEETLENTTG